MAEKALGLVGIVGKGTYNASTTYQKGNFVYYIDSSYLALKDNLKGVTPTDDNVNWRFLARGSWVNITYSESTETISIPNSLVSYSNETITFR